ncbi:YraN family protein [Natranaerofaba carboxydovora]|uniref:YraN family protein n=1 Tax=Natranaerofaba carboxydovora TaxID=2742683 RepID=UPI001F12C52A|nr:YraN family protein [Natranaerofaba carboxydovora]UMZ73342.1 hypothetical protein ACONDI_00895 [Natranaerofaba carboxydovora]
MGGGNIRKGKIGEELAEKLLKKQGYLVLEKNFRTRTGEIDIICKENDTIVFVEVKTRQDLNFGLPEEAVDFRKMAKIKKVANIYISRLSTIHPNKNYDFRFDVVSVILDSKENLKSIKLLNNAF